MEGLNLPLPLLNSCMYVCSCRLWLTEHIAIERQLGIGVFLPSLSHSSGGPMRLRSVLEKHPGAGILWTGVTGKVSSR